MPKKGSGISSQAVEGLGTRDRIIRSAGELFERKGFHGTGIAEIIAVSGAPKGSVYYHFPGGKEEIAAEAVILAGATVAERIHQALADRPNAATALRAFVETIAHYVEASGYGAGGPLLIIASETALESAAINSKCREAYSLLRQGFAECLEDAGLGAQPALGLATTVMAAIEGGIVLSRTFHSGDPLRRIAKDLGRLVTLSIQTAATRDVAKGVS